MGGFLSLGLGQVKGSPRQGFHRLCAFGTMTAIVILAVAAVSPSPLSSGRPEETIRFRITPAETCESLTVRADFRLRGRLPYLLDFGQLASVRWSVNGAPFPVELERIEDRVAFRGLPSSGEATAIYTLDCVTEPVPGYRKRLVGLPGAVMARAGLFLCLVGYERADIDVRWELPADWELGFGQEGTQSWADTQKTLWLAARNPSLERMTVQGNSLRLVVLEGVGERQRERLEEATKAAFVYAQERFGPLEAREFGLAVFPRGGLGGGTALGTTIATEDDFLTAVHELLHWWTNHRSPAWFREGVHSYMTARILRDLGILGQDLFERFLELCLEEHRKVVAREGRLLPLAESSRNYDRNQGGGDMYGLMPVFAYRLDEEIGTDPHASVSGLERVFAVVCRNRTIRFDLLDLIRQETGYDARPLFQDYFEKTVTDPEILLKKD